MTDMQRSAWQRFKDWFCGDEEEPVSPSQAKASVEAAPVPEVVEVPPDESKSIPKLVCTLTNEKSHPADRITELKKKTRRRALRHFRGKEVRHRVTEKNAKVIEFAYYRRAGNPVKIRWQKPEL